jgi:hypothetical protein
MATIEDTPQTNISSEAYDLLDCFVGGLDKLVYGIAADIARQRSSEPGGAAPVQIEEQDVVQAGKRVIDVFKELIQKGKLRGDLADIVSDAEKCFTWRQQKTR